MRAVKKGKKARILSAVLTAVMVLSLLSPMGPFVQTASAAECVPMPDPPEEGYKVMNYQDSQPGNGQWGKRSAFNRRTDLDYVLGYRSLLEVCPNMKDSFTFRGDQYYAYRTGHNISWSATIFPREETVKLTHPDIVQWLSFGDQIEYVSGGFKYLNWQDYPSRRGLGGDAWSSGTITDYIIADLTSPGTQGWTATLEEVADGSNTVIIWLQERNPETLRPANYGITWEQLKNVKIKLGVVPRTDPGTKDIIYVTAEAVKLESEAGKIGFQITEQDWNMLCDLEFTLPDGTVVQGTEYQVITYKGEIQNGKYFLSRYSELGSSWFAYDTVACPITDLAGNPVIIGSGNVRANNLILDCATPTPTMVQVSGSSVVEAEVEPDKWPEDLEWSSLFTKTGGTVQANVVLSEVISSDYASIKDAVKLVWSITDSEGNPVTTQLKAIDNEARLSNQEGKVSRLVFEPLLITDDMQNNGTQIKPLRVIGADLVKDSTGNCMDESGVEDLLKITVDNQTYLDNRAPQMTRGQTVKTVDEETGTIHYVSEWNVNDGVDTNGEGLVFAGLMPDDASTPNGSISISGVNDCEGLEFKYAFTDSVTPPAESEMYFSEGGTGHLNLVLTKDASYYLHLLIPSQDGVEVDFDAGLDLQVYLRDCIGNESTDTLKFTDLGIDNKNPELELTAASPVISRINDTTNQVVFSATVNATDLNDIAAFHYKWDGEEWQTYDLKGAASVDNVTLSKTVQSTNQEQQTLTVRVYDKTASGEANLNHVVEKSVSYSVDLNRPSANYTVTGDVTVPNADVNVSILEPSYNGTLAEGQELYTRTTLKMGDKTYVLIMDGADYVAEGTPLIGREGADWYEVTIEDGNYTTVTNAQQPDWEYYGELTFSFASGLQDLTPVVGEAVDKTDDITRQNGDSVKMLYAPAVENLILLTESPMKKYVETDASGKAEYSDLNKSSDSTGTYSFYKFFHTMDGSKYIFALQNLKNPLWIDMDRNTEKSYMVLLKLDQNGNIVTDESGTPVEVTERRPLSPGETQNFVLPYKDKNGNVFETGAYKLMVYVEQNCGAGQTFYLSPLLLDASKAPQRVGIFSYESTLKTDSVTLDNADTGIRWIQSAAEGDYLRYLTIGAAAPSWYVKNNTEIIEAETVSKDGDPLYTVGTVNSLSGQGMIRAGQYSKETLTFSIDMAAEDTYQTWLGTLLGQPSKIRVWNGATENGRENAHTIHFTQEEPADILSNDLILNLNWYIEGASDDTCVVSEEELKTANHSQFLKVKKGENVICYEVVMQNGAVGPEKQFILDIDTEAPTVEADFEFGPSEFLVETSEAGDETVTRYTEYIDVSITDLTTAAGDVKVYHGSLNGSDYAYEEVDATQPIRLERTSDGYKGIFGNFNANYSTNTDVHEFICVTDASGNATCIYPITGSNPGDQSVYNKNNANNEYPNVIGYMELNLFNSLESPDNDAIDQNVNDDFGNDGVSYKLVNFYDYEVEEKAEYFTIQLDEGEVITVYSDPEDPRNDFSGVNAAGIVDYANGKYVSEYNESDIEVLSLVLPYDASVPEGEEVLHTITITAYGWQKDPNQERAVESKEFTIIAPNTKPMVSVDEETVYSYGSVVLDSNSHVKLEKRAGDGYTHMPDFPAFYNGDYEVAYEDKYGNSYTTTLEFTGFGEDPKIEFSTTDLTCKPVTITITAVTANGIVNVDESVFPTGTTIEGNGTGVITIVVPENVTFNVTYADRQFPVTVSNINTTPISAQAQWLDNLDAPDAYLTDKDGNFIDEEGNILGSPTYDDDGNIIDIGENVKPVGVFYRNIKVQLTDANGSKLIDPDTGVAPQFTFIPGGETSYTFSGYVNQYGMEGEDITVELPILLQTRPIDTTANDFYKPNLQVTAFRKYNGKSAALNGVYQSLDASRPEDAGLTMAEHANEVKFTDIDDFLQEIGWAQSCVFNIEIADENNVKLFLASDPYGEVPDYKTGSSEKITGVSLVGTTLEITENNRFVLHAVDKKGNVNSILFNVTNLGTKAPDPNYAQVLDKEGNIRVYLLPPNLEGVTELAITNTNPAPATEDDTLSLFCGYPYMTYSYETDTEVEIGYSYKYEGMVYTGTLEVVVQAVDKTPPTVKKQTWSANYDATGKRLTNQDISVQLEFDKELSDLEIVDAEGNAVSAPDGMSMSWLANKATIIFGQNTADEVYLKVTAKVNKRTDVIALPVITTIDTVLPEITAESVYSENHRSAVVTITANEDVIFQLTGQKGTCFKETVTENGEHIFRLADMAGNIVKAKVNITDLITEELSLVVGTGAVDHITIVEPAIYEVEIGETLYVKTNRAATISVNKGIGVSAEADTWTPLVITEDVSGMFPTIYAKDTYGNTALVQFEQIPIADRIAPVVFVKQNMISASVDLTADEIDAILFDNILCSDETSATSDLDVEFEYSKTTGKVSVVYRVADEAGNVTERTGWIRFYKGQEVCVKVNGEKVERESTTIVPNGTQTITVEHNGEAYKVDWKAGIKKAAQMKIGSTSLTGYTEETSNNMTIEFTESGYYTFLITTQGRDEFRFVLLVED